MQKWQKQSIDQRKTVLKITELHGFKGVFLYIELYIE